MNTTIRWGIWGTGAVAHRMADDLRLVDGAVLHAVASRTAVRAKEFGSRYGANKTYEGLPSLLADPEVDVVYIATPNHRHFKDCLACLYEGKAVLCEKPLALNLSQAQMIADLARLREVFCMEAMWTRFIPAVQEARRLVQEGSIGPVRLIQGNFAYPTPRSAANRLFDVSKGGGALLDRGVYLISLAQDLLGRPESIQGAAIFGPSGVDEVSSGQLSFSSGAVAVFSSSLVVRGTNELTISGENGSIRLFAPFFCSDRLGVEFFAALEPGRDASSAPSGARAIAERLRRHPAAQSLRRRFRPLLDSLRSGRVRRFPFAGNGYQFEIQEVNRCIESGITESPAMTLNDSLGVMRTMDDLRSQWGLIYPQEYAELQASNTPAAS
ncbi:MAG TPA: Gfo/Idh/MocA family oxidoreductase [Terracidiphilus sp.]|nr:Gfo/Idh/MocA family oxidoreductase [Terracidiphilus sp.]